MTLARRAPRGAADATYEFEVGVVVPNGPQPGPAARLVTNSATDPPRDLVLPINPTC